MVNKIIVLSLPRCGSSVITSLISSAGYKVYAETNLLGPSVFNKDGYFEDTKLTLLNDQLIRMVYGGDYSFIHTPSLEEFKNKTVYPANQIDFEYDLDDIYFPPDYNNKTEEYIGCSWDVWGLTRMLPNTKWYKAYSKFKIKTHPQIISALNEVTDYINNYKENIILKDPRLALVLPFYKFTDCKYVFIKRNKENTLKSMRNHYGKNIFTQNYLPDTKYCSNHFNYKVKYQDFDYYYKTYTSIIEENIKDKESFVLNYEDLSNGNTINKLNTFINGNININLLKL
jgi:hypothetical protein